MAGPIKVNVPAVNAAAAQVKTLAGGLESGLAQLNGTAQQLHGLLGSHQSAHPFEAEWKRQLDNNHALDRDLRALSDILTMVAEGFSDADNNAANGSTTATSGTSGSSGGVAPVVALPVPNGGAPIIGSPSPTDSAGGSSGSSDPPSGAPSANSGAPPDSGGTAPATGGSPDGSTGSAPTDSTGATSGGDSQTGSTGSSGSVAGSTPESSGGSTPAVPVPPVVGSTSAAAASGSSSDNAGSPSSGSDSSAAPVRAGNPVSSNDLGQHTAAPPAAFTVDVPVPQGGVLAASSTTPAAPISSGGISVGAAPGASVGVPVTGGAIQGGMPAAQGAVPLAVAGSDMGIEALVVTGVGAAAAAFVPAIRRKDETEAEEDPA